MIITLPIRVMAPEQARLESMRPNVGVVINLVPGLPPRLPDPDWERAEAESHARASLRRDLAGARMSTPGEDRVLVGIIAGIALLLAGLIALCWRFA